jgi:hypothetical protein
MREYLNDLKFISATTRHEIEKATIELLERHGKNATPDDVRPMFLAALDGMADLVQYGELGPAAINRLHEARERAGIPLP